MPDIARYVRIFDEEPSDDLVNKRTTTIGGMTDKFLKLKTYADCFQIAEDLALTLESNGTEVPEGRAIEIEGAIRAQSSAFNREKQNLQILTCFMLSALKAVESGQPSSSGRSTVEIIAVSIWLSLGIQLPRQEPKLEALRLDLIDASKNLIHRSTEGSRSRSAVPDPDIKFGETIDAKTADSINKGVLKSIDALRQNAALDREELDLLWWALGDWSDLQNLHFEQLPMPVAALTAGVECSKLLRRLPSESHKQLALRHIVDGSDLNAAEFAHTLGEGSSRVRNAISDPVSVQRFPHIFCLLAAISGQVLNTQQLGIRSWGGRAMLESTLLRLSQSSGPLL
jgi:hypothetical protein